jgi:threonine dehydrogenase-like Zn-dependent dehydrogenase
VPQAHYGPIKVPDGPSDDQFLFLSDVLPTAWQAVQNAAIPDGGSVVVFGLGPIGQMASRIAVHLGYRVIAIDRVDERLAMASKWGVKALDMRQHDDGGIAAVRDMTEGRGTDAAIDAVGMEAHGAPVGRLAHQIAGLLPDAIVKPLMQRASIDRLNALYLAIDIVRRGGTISLSGVYGGYADPLPMMTLFDKQIQLRMGQANVKRWVDDILPLLTDEDPLGVKDFATHRLPLAEAPEAYARFQKREDGTVKVLFKP